jgi:hypothetical protein
MDVTSMNTVNLFLEPSPIGENDLPIAERLMNAFHRMMTHERSAIPATRRANSGLWEVIKRSYHGDFYRVMEGRNVKTLADFLRNALRDGVAYGFGTGPGNFKKMVEEGKSRDSQIANLRARLVALAEAVGALQHESPELGTYGKNSRISLSDLVRKIEAQIGPIYRPPVMGMYGLTLDEGRIIDPRVPDDAYCTYRIGTLKAALGLTSICEIGAGFGGTAFQVSRTGLFNRYTMVDLPSSCTLQGFFLMKVLGQDAVALFGEDPSSRPVEVLPYWEFFDRHRHFDLVFNRDSMPEMPRAQADAYLKEMAHRRATFFSVNQETGTDTGEVGVPQLNVHEIVKECGGMISLVRCPYWTRKGYIEEIFRPVISS